MMMMMMTNISYLIFVSVCIIIISFAMPNSRLLIARTGMEDGFQGQAVEIKAAVANVMKDNSKVISELARLCGQPVLKLETEIKRDFYLTAPEAAAYGLIDKVMTPSQPVKMMRYRGSDDDVITFGHFSEARRVKEGPLDKVPSPENDEAFDEYAAEQMKRAPPKKADRFSGSRCKPISISPSGGGDGKDKVKKDLSKNSGTYIDI